VLSKGFAGAAEHRLANRCREIRSLGPKFSGPDDCANLVNCLQGAEN
jgi:hypothetical protein